MKYLAWKDKTELNKALRTSIGALREIFKKPELSEKLNSFTTQNSIWNPTEGTFDVFSKLGIYRTLKLLNKNEIIIIDEFFEIINSFKITSLFRWFMLSRLFICKRHHNGKIIFSNLMKSVLI